LINGLTNLLYLQEDKFPVSPQSKAHISNNSDSFFIKQPPRKFMGNIKEKKVGVAGLQPTLISLDYGKLSN